MIRFFILSLILLSSTISSAYIPKFWLVLSRAAENHGRGVYVVEQDVSFNHKNQPLIVNERWTIKSSNEMHLVATGRKGLKELFRVTYLYENGNRYYLDSSGNKKVVKTGQDWFEPYFHFRYSKKIKPHMFTNKMIPVEALEKPKGPYILKDISNNSENFMRLSRVAGSISYGIGKPSAKTKGELSPGLWIEQDKFVVRKIRFPSQVEIRAGRYNRYSRGLWLPRVRSVKWDDNKAIINVGNVKGINFGPKTKAKLNHRTMNLKKDPQLSRILPDDPVIKEFYTRFR